MADTDAALVLGRQSFNRATTAAMFEWLEQGLSRQEFNNRLRALRGRGLGNDNYAALRKTHRQYLRARGFDVSVKGSRGWVTDRETGKLLHTADIPKDRLLPQSRRPEAPRNLRALNYVLRQVFDTKGRPLTVSDVVETGPGLPSIRSQLESARFQFPTTDIILSDEARSRASSQVARKGYAVLGTSVGMR